MGNYLTQNFEVKPDTKSVEALTRWRNVFAIVKDKKRRFRFTADLSKRHKAAALRIAQEGLLEDVETTEDHAIDMDLDHNPNPLSVGLELEREPSSVEPSYVNDTKRLVHTAANNMRKMICCKVFYMSSLGC
ncbi:uncharacterized protein LOC110724532 [Chenopodium quinoa]|uniref:uncharacterized protein LOC110724532 n=1 Tax=Chenopodium quinoa TaxID=63459 RepID=UPI000B76C461|nr:uncharacterized protein LOC110724532 [Chenopodium quinoa]